MVVDNEGAFLPAKRIVLFMDILGFSDLIARMSQEPHLYLGVRGILKTVQGLRDRFQEEMAGKLFPGEDSQSVPHMTQFSDSIVISYPLYFPSQSAASIILETKLLITRLFSEGVFVRGGIACGWAYHEESLLLGEGVIAAYKLESQVAHVPRIVVADEVVSFLTEEHSSIRQNLGNDSDGCWFIKPFSGLLYSDVSLQQVRNDKRLQDELAIRFALVGGYLLRQLDKIKGKGPNLLAKYRWLANQFNADIKEMGISVETIPVP